MSRDSLTSVLRSGPAMVVTTLAALAFVLSIGWKAHDIIGAAQAGQVSKIEAMAADLAELNKNMARVMDRLNIEPEPRLPVRRSGIGR